MANPSTTDGIERGFTRVAIKLTTIDAETGEIRQGGIVFCPDGPCFLHLIKYPKSGVYEYKGCTFFDEKTIPDEFAWLEFVECYKKVFDPSIPLAIEAEIIGVILGVTLMRRNDAEPRVIIAAIEE